MKQCKVLWIDDKPNDDFIDDASESYDLEIIPEDKGYIPGIEWLKNNRNICSAVILDVNCLEGSGEQESPSKTPFDDNLQEIIAICCNPGKPLIPWFVYTAGDYEGIESLSTQISSKRIWDDRKFYKKPKEREDLLKNIRKAIELSPLFQYVKQYKDILEVFPEKEVSLCLLRIIDIVHKNETTNSSAYNDIRKVLESVAELLKSKGLFPEDQNSLSAASYYMREICKQSGKNLVPSYISFCFSTCEDICNDGSHNGGETPLKVDQDTANGKAPYLIRCAFSLLCNIIHWADSLPSSENEIMILRNKVNDLHINTYTYRK